jgi:hypothetical protein
MSVEQAAALAHYATLNDLQRKEIESLRAVLVHIKLDVEEWREGGEGAMWSGTVLDTIGRRVAEKLHEPPSVIDTPDAQCMSASSASPCASQERKP